MRLYVDDKANSGKRIYLSYKEDSRAELLLKMGWERFIFSDDKVNIYTIQDVKAEPDWKFPPLPGLIVGFFLGLVFLSPTFVILFSCLGGVMSELQHQPDYLKAQKFNES